MTSLPTGTLAFAVQSEAILTVDATLGIATFFTIGGTVVTGIRFQFVESLLWTINTSPNPI